MTARQKTIDDPGVAGIAAPAGPDLPPRLRRTAVLAVTSIVDVAAETINGPVQPVQAVATRLVGLQRRREKLQRTCGPSTLALRDEPFLRELGLVVMKR